MFSVYDSVICLFPSTLGPRLRTKSSGSLWPSTVPQVQVNFNLNQHTIYLTVTISKVDLS
jgi:hypothetical protein